jgi:hypothetical protein
MKTNTLTSSLFTQRIVACGVRPIGLGILVIVMAGQIDCVASKLGSVHVISAPATGEPIQLDPGAVGVTTTDRPAMCGYDRPQGQINRAADGAGEAASAVLGMTIPEYPEANILVSAIGFVGAPVAAAIGGVHASRSRLPQAKLAECEAGLAQALTNMSQQNHLRDRILDAAKVAGRRRFVSLPAADVPAPQGDNREPTATPLVGTILQTRVEELRLERKGAGDSSFALRIKARVRTLRSSTGEVLSDEAFEYQSGKDLFLDWALNRGEPFQKCTDFGYRRLADQIIERMFEATGEAPILVGAGAPKPSVHTPRPQVRLAACRPARGLPPQVQLVSQASDPTGTLYVYSASPGDFMSVQMPLTKDEAVSEAQSDIDSSLGELVTHPNTFVALTAIAAAIPLSIYQQTAGGIRGLSEKKYCAADAQVTTVTRSSRPAATLAREIAQTLGSRCSESVVLLDKPRDDGEQLALARPAAGKPMLVSWPGDGPANSRAGDKALEIEVLSAVLKGDGSFNPSLAVHLEARATLLRSDDGREIYSCPVHYRGPARKFTAWAANDAKLFREELQRCYGKLSGTVIDQLVARRLIAPGGNPNLFVADNKN